MRAIAFAVALFAASTAAAEPVVYTLDPAHTQVAFSIERMGFNRVLGRFDSVSGEMTLDEANPQNSSVRATIQIGSVSTGDATRDEHLRSPRWLNAAGFPTMEFRSTSVRLTGERRAEVTGELTLLGQTHPVTLDVTLNRIGEAPSNRRQSAGFSATGSLSRGAFGSTTAQGPISDAVSISIEALAVVPAGAN